MRDSLYFIMMMIGLVLSIFYLGFHSPVVGMLVGTICLVTMLVLIGSDKEPDNE